jgi:hypothetical protein
MLSSIDGFQRDPEWIADRLGIDTEFAEQAIDKLILIEQEDFPEIVAKINKFRREIIMEYGMKGKAKNQLYQLQLGFYPLTVMEDKPKK